MRVIAVLLLISWAALTHGNASPVSASPPGANGKIAFDSNREAYRAIHVMDPDGSNVRRLTFDGVGESGQPAWSPDGTKIAFDTNREPLHFQVWVMNADGSDQHRLSLGQGNNASPSWSPDGREIAFDSDSDGNYEIYAIGSDGTNQRNLTRNAASDTFPSWSPDGAHIAFQSNRSGNYDIWIMNADGTSPRDLTPDSTSEWDPEWSPDGTRIAFSSHTGGQDGQSGLQVIDVDGEHRTQISYDNDGSPSWSPDGSQITFSRGVGGVTKIYSMNADGSDVRLLADGGSLTADASWQPLTCTVSGVADGDTFDCAGGRHVRMLGIDAPKPGDCGGDWAKAALENIFLPTGRSVRLVYGGHLRDDAGFDIASPIWRGDDGTDYNLSVVLTYVGLARAAADGNVLFANWLQDAEGWARAAGWNMWAPDGPFNGGVNC